MLKRTSKKKKSADATQKAFDILEKLSKTKSGGKSIIAMYLGRKGGLIGGRKCW